jgi:hypothetical protein
MAIICWDLDGPYSSVRQGVWSTLAMTNEQRGAIERGLSRRGVNIQKGRYPYGVKTKA